MARDYEEGYGQENDRGFLDRVGNKLHQTWDRLAGNENERRGQSEYPTSSYRGGGASDDYRRNTRYPEESGPFGESSSYGQSHLGRYSPQQGSNNSYGSSDRVSNSPYGNRQSDQGWASSQRGSTGRDQHYTSHHERSSRQNTPYGASGAAYDQFHGSPYGSSQQGYDNSADYGAPSGGYGPSSMGFPRGSDYGSGSDYGGGGSGSMGGGYFGSGAGPWSGGPYSDTGRGGYTPQRNQNSSEEDYRYSRREQQRRGASDEHFGNYYNER